jgi:hypothetical protein
MDRDAAAALLAQFAEACAAAAAAAREHAPPCVLVAAAAAAREHAPPSVLAAATQAAEAAEQLSPSQRGVLVASLLPLVLGCCASVCCGGWELRPSHDAQYDGIDTQYVEIDGKRCRAPKSGGGGAEDENGLTPLTRRIFEDVGYDLKFTGRPWGAKEALSVRQMLYEEMVDPNHVSSRGGATALHAAIWCGNTDAVQLLLSNPRFTSLDVANRKGMTALDCAYAMNDQGCVKLLEDQRRAMERRAKQTVTF